LRWLINRFLFKNYFHLFKWSIKITLHNKDHYYCDHPTVKDGFQACPFAKLFHLKIQEWTKTTKIELKLIALQVNSKDVNRFQMVSLYNFYFVVFFVSCSATPCGFWAFNIVKSYPKQFISENHNWVKAKERNTVQKNAKTVFTHG